MGPALDIRPLELEDEPVPKRDRMVKPMTKKECSILTKVFDETSHCRSFTVSPNSIIPRRIPN